MTAHVTQWYTAFIISYPPQTTLIRFLVFYCPFLEVRKPDTVWNDFICQYLSHRKSLKRFWLNFVLTFCINIRHGNLKSCLDFTKDAIIKNDNAKFKAVLRKYLNTHSLYYVVEFVFVKMIYNTIVKNIYYFYTVKLFIFVFLWLFPHPTVLPNYCRIHGMYVLMYV